MNVTIMDTYEAIDLNDYLITDGTRFGAEYELIQHKRSFTRIISQEPDKLVPLSERFAVLAKQIHQKPADNIFHLDTDTLKAHWTAFAKTYYGTDSQEVLDKEIQKLQPFIFVKMAFLVSKLCDGKRPLSEFIIQRLDKALPNETSRVKSENEE